MRSIFFKETWKEWQKPYSGFSVLSLLLVNEVKPPKSFKTAHYKQEFHGRLCHYCKSSFSPDYSTYPCRSILILVTRFSATYTGVTETDLCEVQSHKVSKNGVKYSGQTQIQLTKHEK